MKSAFLFLPALVLLASPARAEDCGARHKITDADIRKAQTLWAEGIVAIGKAKDPKAEASGMIDRLYAYGKDHVLFKPTKASADEFRETKEQALSYFVGGLEPEDKGFALAPFSNVRFDNNQNLIACDVAMSQGNYYFMGPDGKEIKVDYSFGYKAASDGTLKIILHHSSLPYKPE